MLFIMKHLLIVLFTVSCLLFPSLLFAQKSYKVVCDKTDGKVKIVESTDRSPNVVPLKGGFPFYQVAEKWIKENYPNGTCDPNASLLPAQPASPDQNQPVPGERNLNDFFNIPPDESPSLQVASSPDWQNTLLHFSLLFSDLGKVYSLDPPMIPGFSIEIRQLIGKNIYGGTGLGLNLLIGKTEQDEAGVNSFYSGRIPLFIGYRQYTPKNHWKVELGLAANTELKPFNSESNFAGETASNNSIAAITRVAAGTKNVEFEFGIDAWLSDILLSEGGYKMTILSIGLNYNF